MNYKVTAFDLKLALLQYLRFNRQWVCVDEFEGADVVADTGKSILEIEVKVDKGDLVNKEAYKTLKHHCYRIGRPYRLLHPNNFYFCVPEILVKSAQEVCEKLNPKYGIIAFNPCVFERHIQWNYKEPHRECIRMARSAKKLHESYVSRQKTIAMRASSKIVSQMYSVFRRNLGDIKETKNDRAIDRSTKICPR